LHQMRDGSMSQRVADDLIRVQTCGFHDSPKWFSDVDRVTGF